MERNLRKEIESLKKLGFMGYVAYENKSWKLFEKNGFLVSQTCLGRENCEKRIDELKKELKQ